MSQDGAPDEVDVHAAQTHMAVALCKGTLGVAWYDSTCGEVRFAFCCRKLSLTFVMLLT